MIKKNTKVVFEGDADAATKELMGGMPLSKGELVHVHSKNPVRTVDYVVADKTVDCYLDGAEPTVDITYVLRRKK
ncbi:MAG: hypothetical protein Q7R47_06835 [Candidatus Diapherotrites archaeon]|nr:hypothetical protein [Candidatus Diapherotrites archaeon]